MHQPTAHKIQKQQFRCILTCFIPNWNLMFDLLSKCGSVLIRLVYESLCRPKICVQFIRKYIDIRTKQEHNTQYKEDKR
jgi:hypothetical protein